MQWMKTDDVQSGDIVETISRIPDHSPVCRGMMLPIVKHYGMVVNVDGEKCLAHNIIGRTPTITPLDEVFQGRKIERVLRTGMCDRQIIDKFNSCKEKKYSVWNWNCENLVVFLSGSSIGFPQRDGYSLGLALLIVIVLIVVFSRKRNS